MRVPLSLSDDARDWINCQFLRKNSGKLSSRRTREDEKDGRLAGEN
jgi:hypothetical protein